MWRSRRCTPDLTLGVTLLLSLHLAFFPNLHARYVAALDALGDSLAHTGQVRLDPHNAVGLNLGALTPAEIALSIVVMA
jgi:hypothetical protein